MKLIKSIIFLILILLVLNRLGMLSDSASKKVDKAVLGTKEKINEFQYKDKHLLDMSLKEISSNISSDITYLKEKSIVGDEIKLSGKELSTIINLKNDKILIAEIDTSNSEAVTSLEELFKKITNKNIKIPNKMLNKANMTITLEKVNGEYKIKFD